MPIKLILPIRRHLATPAQKRAYNQGLFTRVAAGYDRATRLMSLGRDQHWKQRLIAALPAWPAPRCLDLACGTGDLTVRLAHKYPHGQIVGLDLTPSMLEVARRRSPPGQVRFLCQDMSSLEWPDGWADIVTGSYALRNAPHLEEALREIRRVLRPGGRAAFLDFCKSPRRPVQIAQLGLLKVWGGFWGIVVHGGPEHAYIAESLRQFPDHQQFARQLTESGFGILHRQTFMLGLLELLILLRVG